MEAVCQSSGQGLKESFQQGVHVTSLPASSLMRRSTCLRSLLRLSRSKFNKGKPLSQWEQYLLDKDGVKLIK